MPATNQDVGVSEPFVQGDSLTLSIPVFQADGTTPQDLSAASAIRWEVHRSLGGVPVGAALVAKSIGDGINIVVPPEDGVFEIDLESADSEDLAGTYHHEAEVLFTGGVRTTVLTGRWMIQRAGVKPAA